MTQQPPKQVTQGMIHLKLFGILAWIEAYLRDCKARDLSAHTVTFYRAGLAAFAKFCEVSAVTEVEQIAPDTLRAFLLHLETTGHNPGGKLAKFRAVRAFLRWYENEAEPQAWSNPIAKVKPPKAEQPPITGVSLADVRALLDTCGGDFIGLRDRALILALLDTGARAGEFLSVNVNDIDVIGGDVMLRKTKGKRARVVFLGKKTRRALRAYLKQRQDESPALWVTRSGDRLAVKSLQSMLRHRAKIALLKDAPSPHDFRRAHALQMVRAGVDVFTLARLMGHKDINILKQYLAIDSTDLQAAHDRGGPVDKLF